MICADHVAEFDAMIRKYREVTDAILRPSAQPRTEIIASTTPPGAPSEAAPGARVHLYCQRIHLRATGNSCGKKELTRLSLADASGVQAFGWMVTTAIAFYCVRHGNITHWMMRSYPFAMVFTVARLIILIPPS